MVQGIAADFTAPDEEVPVTCERIKCPVKNFPAGTKLHYVWPRGPEDQGKFVCAGCNDYYTGKKGTELRDYSAADYAAITQTRSQALNNDKSDIHRHVARAQRFEPGANPIVRVGRGVQSSKTPSASGSMGPPERPAQLSGRGGPSVGVPGLSASSVSSGRVSSLSKGPYGGAHLQYNFQQQRMSVAAKTGTTSHHVTIQAKLAHMPMGTTKFIQIRDCWVSVPGIPPRAGYTLLFDLFYERIMPKWENNFPHIHLPATALTLYRKDSAEVLPTEEANAIADVYFKHNNKGELIFKAPNTPYIMYLLIDSAFYDEVLDIEARWELEKAEAEKEAASPLKRSKQRQRRKGSEWTKAAQEFKHESDNEDTTEDAMMADRNFGNSQDFELGQPSDLGSLKPSTSHAHTDKGKKRAYDIAKRDPTLPRSPPAKRTASRTAQPNVSSNSRIPAGIDSPSVQPGSSTKSRTHSDLEAALRAQTSVARKGPEVTALFSERPMQVLIRAVQDVSLDDLIRDPFMNLHETSRFANLVVNFAKDRRLVGAVKVGYQGTINPPLTGEAGKSVATVCAKQTYAILPGRYPGTHELVPHDRQRQAVNLTNEVRCIAWGHALLKDTYAFIKEQRPHRGLPSFGIYHMRFVSQGLAIDGGGEGQVFMIEEWIDPESNGAFRKYINNNSALPRQFSRTDDQDRAEFLAFTQHVQFQRTHGLAYVTDYQGGHSLLTDPQIVTHPKLGPIFASGNIPQGYENFPKEHECNKWCLFYDLQPLADIVKDCALADTQNEVGDTK